MNESMSNRTVLKGTWPAVVLAALLAGCGGGGGGGASDPAPAETLFTQENAWKGPRPAAAESVTPEVFRQGIASGELVLAGPGRLAAQRAARERQMRADRDYLAALPTPGPAVQALLADAASGQAVPGDVAMVANDQTVALLGLEVRLREAVEAHQRSQSVDNALLVYAQTYALLAAAVKTQVPTPDSLGGQPIETVRAALASIEAALSAVPSLDRTRPDLLRAPTSRARAHDAVNPGQGRDYSSTCSPTNFAGTKWFPLKNFVSPVKDQGSRGTCWAFTAIGALESRERVQNNNPADLSEQFLVNKVKEDWDSDDDVEGYWSTRAVDLAADKNQVLPAETTWTYNFSSKRAKVESGNFGGACDPYGQGAGGGTCSESSHQSREVCTTAVFEFCAYRRVSYTGPGVASSRSALLWSTGERFDLNRYRLLLSQGVVLMASTPIYVGLSEAPRMSNSPIGTRGVVSDFAIAYRAADGSLQPGSSGGHAMQVVGFLSNAELGPPGSPATVAGGGYFVIKNSWGCNAGDAGYYYIPADYVQYRFSSLSVLNFEARRSDAWNTEQALPGSLTPPTIALRLPEPPFLDLRVPKDIARYFRVTHPAAKSVQVTITSNIDGVVFDGAWDTDPYSLAGTTAMVTATTLTPRIYEVTARYGSTQTSQGLNVEVLNTSPRLKLTAGLTARVAENFAVTAQPTDLNEPDAKILCANTSWQVDAPDTLSTQNGCLQQVRFGATGARTIRVRTSDREGATAEQALTVEVQPPPPNPYPRITRAEVLSREIAGTAPFRSCRDAAVSPGGSIDLRQRGCTAGGLEDSGAPRYTASVDIENPSAERVQLDWNIWVMEDYGVERLLFDAAFVDAGPLLPLTSPGKVTAVTRDCRIVLDVLVPADAARNKRQTVWLGRCTYLVGTLN